jgi:hypothetical protein
MSINDPLNLVLATELANPNVVDSNIDLPKAEDHHVNNTPAEQSDYNAGKEFNELLEQIGNFVEVDDNLKVNEDTTTGGSHQMVGEQPTVNGIPSPPKSLFSGVKGAPHAPEPLYRKVPNVPPEIVKPMNTMERTPAEQQQHLLNQILGNTGQHRVDDNHDIKMEMLDDINMLIDELTNTGADLSNLPQVSVQSSFDDVRMMHRRLRAKLTFKRHHEIGKDIIVSASQGLGMIFNGENKFFGYQPDLTGWHLSVSRKLKTMKYETSTVIRKIFTENNIPAWLQILMELVPSAFLYAGSKHNQRAMSESSAQIITMHNDNDDDL